MKSREIICLKGLNSKAFNEWHEFSINLKNIERIVQLIYCRLTEESIKPYTGKYKGQKGPTEAYV